MREQPLSTDASHTDVVRLASVRQLAAIKLRVSACLEWEVTQGLLPRQALVWLIITALKHWSTALRVHAALNVCGVHAQALTDDWRWVLQQSSPVGKKRRSRSRKAATQQLGPHSLPTGAYRAGW